MIDQVSDNTEVTLDQIEQFLRDTTPPEAARTWQGDVPAGMTEAARMPLLVCTMDSLRQPPSVEGLTIIEVTSASSLDLIRENLDLNARGFDPAAPPTPDDEAEQFRQGMGSAKAFTARLNGHGGVAAGMYTEIKHATTELAGITTLTEMRGRGIGAALTAAMTANALRSGATVTFLVTDNPTAQRVYERIGYTQIGELTEHVKLV